MGKLLYRFIITLPFAGLCVLTFIYALQKQWEQLITMWLYVVIFFAISGFFYVVDTIYLRAKNKREIAADPIRQIILLQMRIDAAQEDLRRLLQKISEDK